MMLFFNLLLSQICSDWTHRDRAVVRGRSWTHRAGVSLPTGSFRDIYIENRRVRIFRCLSCAGLHGHHDQPGSSRGHEREGQDRVWKHSPDLRLAQRVSHRHGCGFSHLNFDLGCVCHILNHLVEWLFWCVVFFCLVSRSYFLGELEKCVCDPESLAQLFIKHVSLHKVTRSSDFFLLFIYFVSPWSWGQGSAGEAADKKNRLGTALKQIHCREMYYKSTQQIFKSFNKIFTKIKHSFVYHATLLADSPAACQQIK